MNDGLKYICAYSTLILQNMNLCYILFFNFLVSFAYNLVGCIILKKTKTALFLFPGTLENFVPLLTLSSPKSVATLQI